MKQPHLSVDNLCYSVDSAVLLEDVSFSVEKGGYCSIIGPNGAGKTTLVKCINRILDPSGGSIAINGTSLHNLDQRSLARLISYIPQTDVHFSGFTVYEFVMMGRYPYFRPFTPPSDADHDAVTAALNKLQLQALKDRSITTMSGGERQKVLIAASLAQEADIMLMDEPTTFLDSAKEAEIAGILTQLNSGEGKTILSVTHDLNVAMQRSTTVLLLQAGRVRYSGPPQQLMDSSLIDEVFATRFMRISHPASGLPLLIPEHYKS